MRATRVFFGGGKQLAIARAVADELERNDRAARTISWLLQGISGDPDFIRRVVGDDLPPVEQHARLPEPSLLEPPRTAEFCLRLFLPAHQRQHAVGDLLEEYHVHMVPRFGRRRANVWFWCQTMTSVAPALWMQLRRLLKLAFLLQAADWLRRIGH